MDTFVLRTRGATFQTRARPPPHPHVHEPDLGHVALFAVSEEELLRSNAATRVNVHLNAISDPALHRWFHVCIHTVSSSSLQSKKHWLCSHTHTQAHTHTHTHTHTHKTCVGTHCPLTAPEAYASFHMCPCNCFNAVALRSLSICQSTDLTHASRTSLQHNNNQRKKKKTFPCVCVCVCVDMCLSTRRKQPHAHKPSPPPLIQPCVAFRDLNCTFNLVCFVFKPLGRRARNKSISKTHSKQSRVKQPQNKTKGKQKM